LVGLQGDSKAPTMDALWNVLEADTLPQREQQLLDVSYGRFLLSEISSMPYMKGLNKLFSPCENHLWKKKYLNI